MIFKSFAEWTKIPISSDTHNTYKQAIAVRDELLRVYNRFHPCPDRGECIRAWVECIPEEGDKDV